VRIKGDTLRLFHTLVLPITSKLICSSELPRTSSMKCNVDNLMLEVGRDTY
jgi:hypothetical protein